ncbi:MAG: vitamin K epoxide reductase family protein [Gemmatimonadota bacterium]
MLSALLSLLGLFVALYLYLYKIGRIGTLACGTGGCETVQLSPYSRFLGLEVALYGVAGYLVLLVLSLAAVQSPPGDRRWPNLLFLLSGIGLLFTAYLTYLELFVIHAICRWCVGSAVIILSIFFMAWFERRQQTPASGSAPIR